jgi:hypothetical protein
MKHFVLTSIAIFVFQFTFSQDGCTDVTITNPLSPVNVEWSNRLNALGNSNLNRNSFLNSYFNWYDPAKIAINKSNEWAVPTFKLQPGDPLNALYDMTWPWSTSMNNSAFSFLYLDPATLNPIRDNPDDPLPSPQTLPVTDRDYHWEDGWELLYLNLGFLPNGDDVDQTYSDSWRPAQNATNNAQMRPEPNHVPYFVLYNRYRSTMRVFANVFGREGNLPEVDYTYVKLLFLDELETAGSGLFRVSNGVDRPLDKETAEAGAQMISPNQAPADIDEWIVADFQLSYDPCICERSGTHNIQMQFSTFNTLNVDGVFRSITVEKEITQSDLNSDFLNLSDLDPEGAPGARIYQVMNDMYSDYKKKLEAYDAQMNDFKSPLNQAKIYILNKATDAINNGVGKLTGGFVDELIEADSSWSGKVKVEQFGTGLAKALYAQEMDFVSSSLGITQKPSRPQAPVASWNEGSFKATITDEQTYESNTLIVPGDDPGDIQSEVMPHNYPAYSQLPGLFAMLETPEVEFNWTSYLVSDSLTDVIWNSLYSKDEFFLRRYKNQFMLRVKDLSYALNPAIDFDEEKSGVYFMFQVEYEQNYPWQSRFHPAELNGGNLTMDHEFFTHKDSIDGSNNHRRTYVFNSKIYPIEDARNLFFYGDLETGGTYIKNYKLLFTGGDWDWELDPTSHSNANSRANIKSIKLKVIGDFYFDQIGHNGEQVSQYQVFTYDLYNSSREENDVQPVHINQFYPWVSNPFNPSNWPYYPGTVRLGNINDVPAGAKTIVGGELYIRAEKIELDQNASSGYGVTHLEAADKVVFLRDKGASLNYQFDGNWRIKTRDDWFGEPNIQAASKEVVANFCNETSGKYRANIVPASKRLPNSPDVFGSSNHIPELRFKIFPNPTNGLTTIRWNSTEIADQSVWVTVVDNSGTEVVSRQVSVFDEVVQFDLSGLPSGVYMVQLKTESGYTGIRKLVKQ